MSAKMMGKVWELVLTPAKQTVLLAYADHADHNGENIRPGVPLIAWKTGYSDRQVQRITKQLVEDGLLVVRETRKSKATRYGLDFSKGVTKPAFKPRGVPGESDKMSPFTDESPDKMTPPETQRGDILSPLTPDIAVSPRQDDGVTTHGSEVAAGGDIASANLSSIRHKDQPSVKIQKEKAAAAAALGSDSLNAAVVWENEMGSITPVIADTLKDWAKAYPPGWAADAIREAKLSGGQSPKYVWRILERWRREGRDAGPKPGQKQGALRAQGGEEPDGRRYISGKFAEFIER